MQVENSQEIIQVTMWMSWSEVAKINADKYKKKEPYERLKQF